MVSINGPALNANAANTLITQACVEVQDKQHQNRIAFEVSLKVNQ